jgi:DNA-binding transcriptional LysR family regulator
MQKLEGVRSRLAEATGKPSGTLRITTTVGLGSTWLTNRVHEFLDLYPDINLQLILDDQELDLNMREADVAIRLRQPVQPDLIQRRLFTVHMHIYAAPSYLERFGRPETIADVDRHRIVTFGVPVPQYLKNVNWLETAGREAGNPRQPVLRINNLLSIKNAIARGIGIAVLPDYMIENDTSLVRLLPEAEVPSFSTYFVYPAELKNTARVNVFRDFLLAKAENWAY